MDCEHPEVQQDLYSNEHSAPYHTRNAQGYRNYESKPRTSYYYGGRGLKTYKSDEDVHHGLFLDDESKRSGRYHPQEGEDPCARYSKSPVLSHQVGLGHK